MLVLMLMLLVCGHCCVISGETDWKVLAVNVNDPIAQHLNGKPMFCVFILTTPCYTAVNFYIL